jgi:hypothetical protein
VKMNEANRKAVWKAIQTTGDLLVGRLPESSRHPNGRNPYAHAALCVKNKFGCSYKEIPDDQVLEVIEYLEWLTTKSVP